MLCPCRTGIWKAFQSIVLRLNGQFRAGTWALSMATESILVAFQECPCDIGVTGGLQVPCCLCKLPVADWTLQHHSVRHWDHAKMHYAHCTVCFMLRANAVQRKVIIVIMNVEIARCATSSKRPDNCSMTTYRREHNVRNQYMNEVMKQHSCNKSIALASSLFSSHFTLP